MGDGRQKEEDKWTRTFQPDVRVEESNFEEIQFARARLERKEEQSWLC